MVLRLNIFLSLLSFAKCLSIKPRNLRPMLVLTFLLNGGLYQRMSFRCLFFRLAGAVGSWHRLYWYPLSCRAFWYGGAAWSNEFLSDESEESRLFIPAGMFFKVIGGWLLSWWTY